MEHRKPLVSTAEALHRVFLTGNLPRPFFYPRLSHPAQHHQKRPASFVSRRFVAAQPSTQFGPPGRRADRAVPLRDENINARQVHVVSAEGKLQPAQPLQTILSSFDRTTHFLVQVSPPDADQIPVCKILDRQAARAAERTKAKPVKNAQTMSKQLEINWAIGSNDLRHRLKKMVEFLGEGRRVEFVLGPKRKGRVATMEDAEGVLSKIRARAEEVEGAKEWKAAEGAVGAQMMLYFEGKAKK
ncbi:hypothetical protein MMC08_008999 [Hypocenomyce scalaris]|nr:hypothetical protein [Hypocenomyce scalaris]